LPRLFFPLLLEGLNLYVASVQAVWRGRAKAGRLEKALLFAHIVGYLAAIFVVLSPGTAILFIVVDQCVWGGVYMGCLLTPTTCSPTCRGRTCGASSRSSATTAGPGYRLHGTVLAHLHAVGTPPRRPAAQRP
jgi:hypothetical protein